MLPFSYTYQNTLPILIPDYYVEQLFFYKKICKWNGKEPERSEGSVSSMASSPFSHRINRYSEKKNQLLHKTFIFIV